VEIAPRKLWPTGLAALDVPLSGRIPAAELAETGRVVARLTDIGWGVRLRELLSGPDQDVPDDVFDACVRVLAAWDWAQRPTGVVTVATGDRPRLVASLGDRLASVGRLAALGSVGGGGTGERSVNSARRVAQLWRSFDRSVSGVDGPVLLVDSLVDSGWTMTLAARALRRSGAAAVLPFALASAG
jgi:ATP-dependent DNA helicase RecQ